MGSQLSIAGKVIENTIDFPRNPHVSQNYKTLKQYNMLDQLPTLKNKYEIINVSTPNYKNISVDGNKLFIKLYNGTIDDISSIIVRLQYRDVSADFFKMPSMCFHVRLYDIEHNGVTNQHYESIMIQGTWKKTDNDFYELVKRYPTYVKLENQ